MGAGVTLPMVPVPKPERVYDGAWLDAIRRMPCCVCVHLGQLQKSRTEAHHTRTRGAFGGDDSAAPMCHECHMCWHYTGQESFPAKFGIDPREVAARLWAQYQALPFWS